MSCTSQPGRRTGIPAHSVAGPVRFGLEPGRLYLFDAMTQQALGMV